MTRAYTSEQTRAIETDDVDLCVAAGAGSGKTGVLVERFVRIVTQSHRETLSPEKRTGVDRILVITFTDKATREMKTRIVAELSRLRLTEERRQVETAYISTIHGLCSRLLQENPFEANVDPQFTVLDEPQARRLLRQTFEECVAEAYARSDTEVMELIAAVQMARREGEELGDPLVALARAAEGVMTKLRGAGWSLMEIERHWRSGADRTAAQSLAPVRAMLEPLIANVTACMTGLQTLRAGALGAARVACDAVMEQAGCLSDPFRSLPDTLEALEAILKSAGRSRPRASGLPDEITLTQLLHRLKQACEEAKALFGATAAHEARAGLQCHRLWGLIVAVWSAYEAAKRARGALDTDDLQAEAVQLLTRAPWVRDRYRRRFRHLMIDEFQDTNALQMRLIDLLHAPQTGAEDEPAPNRLFLVGDVQQSIYAFRNADPTLFRDIERRYRENGAGVYVPLAVNFRSRPEILNAVTTVFRQVWNETPTPFTPLTPGAQFDARSSPSLEALLTQDLQRRDYVPLEADALAARIRQMVEGEELRLTAHTDPRRGEPVSYRDIAILLRGLNDVQKYEEAFARRGVPLFVVGGGRGYYARHEIRDLLNVLTVLETPLDDIALAATLRSPFVGADVDTLYRLTLHARESTQEDGRREPAALYPALPFLITSGVLPAGEADALERFIETIEALRRQEDRLPVGHLLERLIASTHYDARLLCRPGGRRRLANVRKLLQMANSDPVMGARDFIRRLRDLEKLSDREGDAPTEEEASDVVRLHTIHGAKGLEFPVVVLADLSRGLLIPERGLFACAPLQMALGTKLDREPNLVYRAIDSARQRADKEEAERLLYVAMTRAREHLILCGNIGRNRGLNWADELFSLIGILDVPSEPEIRNAMGGMQITAAPLSHYAQAPLTGPARSSRRDMQRRIDGLADGVLRSSG